MKHYYAKKNLYGNESSYGFVNTWQVLVFDSEKTRDDYVYKESNKNISIDSIGRLDVIRFSKNYDTQRNQDAAPRTFSGEYWGIIDDDIQDIPGYIGTIGVCEPGSNYKPFYQYRK